MHDTANLPRRKIIRLQNFDYSQNGAYFITACTLDRQNLFGQFAEETVTLTPAGQMVEKYLLEIENRFEHVTIIEHIIMPDHIHAIITIVQGNHGGGLTGGHSLRSAPPLQEILHWFKTITTTQYGIGVKNSNFKPYKDRLWQRSFYDHIIRDEYEMIEKINYIRTNPLRTIIKNKTFDRK